MDKIGKQNNRRCWNPVFTVVVMLVLTPLLANSDQGQSL